METLLAYLIFTLLLLPYFSNYLSIYLLKILDASLTTATSPTTTTTKSQDHVAVVGDTEEGGP